MTRIPPLAAMVAAVAWDLAWVQAATIAIRTEAPAKE